MIKIKLIEINGRILPKKLWFLKNIEDCVNYMTFCTQFSNGKLPKTHHINNAVIHSRMIIRIHSFNFNNLY